MPTKTSKRSAVNGETRPIVSQPKLDHILDQYLDDWQNGQVCTHDELQAQHPHLADELASVRKLEVSSVLTFLNWLEAQKLVTKRRADTGRTSWSMLFTRVSKANVYRWVDRIVLASCFVLILFVSAADTWFAAMNGNILNMEMNPLCTWLLRIDPDSCGCFIAGKTCATLLVLLTLFGLLRLKYRHARLVIAAVTLFQLGLLTFLYLSDPLMDDWINFQVLFEEGKSSIFWQIYHGKVTYGFIQPATFEGYIQ